MRILGWIALGLVAAVVVAAIAFAVVAWRPQFEAVARPAPDAFDPDLVARGSVLAAIGNCVDCHTAPGGEPFAGGYPLKTPFGTIYGTNITPDPDTGIGNWSEAAFVRAMTEGVDREGKHLYPAFPYDQFQLATRADLRAIYAFLMTRTPVTNETPANDIPFPFNWRPLLAGWKLLFLDEERFAPDAGQTEAWNRGAYLVAGLGHCGACHTPRNQFGARQEERALAGGESEGWHAPALTEASPAPVPWTEESLFNYLHRGIDERHAIAAGPMARVSKNLRQVPEDEVKAITSYIAARIGKSDANEKSVAAEVLDRIYGRPVSAEWAAAEHGQAIFAAACATCHAETGPLHFNARVDLAFATSIEFPDPSNLIHIILDGVRSPDSRSVPLMPGFANLLTDEQVEAVAAYLRARFSQRPVWEDLGEEVRRIREERGSEPGQRIARAE